jgi:hypothetical protein
MTCLEFESSALASRTCPVGSVRPVERPSIGAQADESFGESDLVHDPMQGLYSGVYVSSEKQDQG